MPRSKAEPDHIEYKPELIELLLTQPINPGSNKGNPVFPINFEKPIGFAEKFSLLLNETPNIGSTANPEFFIHVVLGSVLTLPNSGLMQKLSIDKVYVKRAEVHTEWKQSNNKKIKVTSSVVKLCFSFRKDGKKQIALRIFTNDKIIGDVDLKNDEYRYNSEELREIAGKLGIHEIDNINIDEHVFRICTEGDSGSMLFSLHEEKIDRVKEEFKTVAFSLPQTKEFKEISIGPSTSLEDQFKELSNKMVDQAIVGTREIFSELIQVYSRNQKNFSLSKSEAAYHGFCYGALALNFKYRYGLNCYVERIAGKGRADLVLISRTKNSSGKMEPKPIPIVVEFKAENNPASEAIKQIKNKGYLYNLGIRTKAKDAVIAGVNFAKHNELQVEQAEIFQSRGFLLQLLEGIQGFDGSDASEIVSNLKGELENLYYSIPGNDKNYLSKLVLGQVLAEGNVKLDKNIFFYEKKQIANFVTTFVLCDEAKKAVLLNVIELSGTRTRNMVKKQFDSKKIPSMDNIGINSAVRIDVIIKADLKGEKRRFEVEEDKNNSYFQDIEIEEIPSPKINHEAGYEGKLQKIMDVNIIKLIQGIRNIDAESSSAGAELKESLSPFTKALWPLKQLIKKEKDLQAVMQGLFMHSSSSRESKDIRVYAESNQSPRGRTDLALSFVHLEQGDYFKEEEPIIIELKYAKDKGKVDAKLNEAQGQLSSKYNLLKSFTDKKTARLLSMVFNGSSRDTNINNLITAHIESTKVDHTSQSATSEQVFSSPERKSKIIGPSQTPFGSPFGHRKEQLEPAIPSQFDSPKLGPSNYFHTPDRGNDASGSSQASDLGSPNSYYDNTHSHLPIIYEKILLSGEEFSLSECSPNKKPRKERNIGMYCIDSRDEENITEEEKEQRIKELFDVDKVVKRGKGIYYHQLFKVYDLMLKDQDIHSINEKSFAALEVFAKVYKDLPTDIFDKVPAENSVYFMQILRINFLRIILPVIEDENFKSLLINNPEKLMRDGSLLVDVFGPILRKVLSQYNDQELQYEDFEKLKGEINSKLSNKQKEINDIARQGVNKSDLLGYVFESVKLSIILLLMDNQEVPEELKKMMCYDALISLGALVDDHASYTQKNSQDHLNSLLDRIDSSQLLGIAYSLHSLRSEFNINHSKFSDKVIIDYFSGDSVRDFIVEVKAYNKEVITIHLPKIVTSLDDAKALVKDNNGNYKQLKIGNTLDIQNVDSYVLDEENLEIKLRVGSDKEYIITGESEGKHVKHYLHVAGYRIEISNVINAFTGETKESIHNKLNQLESTIELRNIESISQTEVDDQTYDNIVNEVRQSLLERGVSENTFNQLENHLDYFNKKVFTEYIDSIEKNLKGQRVEFDQPKLSLAKIKGAKSGKFFSLMAIYDLFDSVGDTATLGRHENDALKRVFGINGILDAMDDVRESISTSYMRSDGRVVTKVSPNRALGRVMSKIPDNMRKSFVKVINHPVVQGITFATIAYQFGYSINEITKGNHHPLNYYWTASSGVKLATMSMKPISMGVGAAMKGISATTKVLRELSIASKVLGRISAATMVADILITIGIEIYERVEYTNAIAKQVPLLSEEEYAEVFFAKLIKVFTERDVEKEYEDKIRIKGYLNHVKEVAAQLLNNNHDIAAVVEYVTSIEERYSEVVTSHMNASPAYQVYSGKVCGMKKNYTAVSFGKVNSKTGDLSSLSTSETLLLTPYTPLDSKRGYFVSLDEKHLPHITQDEYLNNLEVVSMPFGFNKNDPTCGSVINSKYVHPHAEECNNGKVYRNCEQIFTFPNQPFIFTSAENRERGGSIVLYLSVPKNFTVAANYQAIIHVPVGDISCMGSSNHVTTFIINGLSYGRLVAGNKTEEGNTLRLGSGTIGGVDLHKGAMHYSGSNKQMLLENIHNLVANVTGSLNVTTSNKTRFINVDSTAASTIQQGSFDCYDTDYEVVKLNEGNEYERGPKQTTFVVSKNIGSAKIKDDSLRRVKNNTDVIFINGTDITQLRINENAGGGYHLELLDNNKQSIVSSIGIANPENLVVKIKSPGVESSIMVWDRSLFDIVGNMKYQILSNLTESSFGDKIIKSGESKVKAAVQINDTRYTDISPYEVAKNITDNDSLGIPISLVRVEKVIGNVTHEAIVENMYPGNVVADFSHRNINCEKIITVGMESYEGKCVVKLSHSHECDRPVNLTLRIINNPVLYARVPNKIVDLTGCNINPADVKCRKSSEHSTSITLNSHINQGSFQVILDNYLRGPEYQYIAFQFNKNNIFYKVNGMDLKLAPILNDHKKETEVDYNSFKYYKPNEQGLQVYHNQPNNENKIGFMDLKDKSMLDSNIEIVDDSLMLLHENNTFMEIKNWNIDQSARKVVFAFNDTMISDLKCIFSTCSPRNIVQKFREEKEVLLKTRLFDAIRQGDLNVVESLVRRGADVNATNDLGNTPLCYASLSGHLSIVEYLVENGANVKFKDSHGRNLIYYASWSSNLGIIRYLVENGVNINLKDKAGYASLWYVSCNGRLDSVMHLVENAADIEVEGTHDRHTPLWCAAKNNHLRIVEYLVSEGADINARDRYNRTPLDIARDREYSNIVKYLEEKLNQGKRKPVQRRRRHHHGDHSRQHSSRKPLAAASSGTRPSSWINDLFGWVKSSIGRLLSSKPEGTTSTTSSISQVDIPIDVNGTIMLLDLLVRKVTGQKYISTVEQSIPLLEARGYALNITTEFEKVLKDTAKRSGVSAKKLSFDFLEVYKAIEGKIISGELSKIPTILYSAIEEACPKNEEFLSIVKGNIEEVLNRQQNRRSGNQMQSMVSVDNKIPLSSLNSTAVEPVNNKKGVTFGGQVV